MPRLPRPASPAAGLCALVCAASVGLALFVYARYGLDWPHYDDLFIASFLEKVADGTVTWHDLFKPFNEHRVVVPRLLISAVSFTFGFNVLILLAITLGLMLLAWAVVARLAWRQTAPDLRTPLFYLANAATCTLVLSGMQQGGWLFAAWQPWFLVNGFFLLAILAASPAQRRPGTARIGLALLACLAAAGSAGHGILTFTALAPLLWQRDVPARARAAGVFALALITLAIVLAYSHGIPNDRPLLGFPLVGLHGVSAAAGAVLVGIWLAAASDTLRDPAAPLSQARLPWLALGLLPLLAAPLVTIGRIGLDEEFAVHYRYVTLNLLLGVAAIQLSWLWWSHRAPRAEAGWAMYAAAGALLCAITARSFGALELVRAKELTHLHGALCAELVHHAPPDCIADLDLNEPSLRKAIARIEHSGVRRFPSGLAFERQPRVSHGYIDKPPAGRVIRMLKGGVHTRQSAVQVTGWAALSERNKPAQIILFSYGDHDLFFASTMVSFDRRDVAEKMRLPGAVHSGWAAQIDAHYLPPGPGTVYAWTYDRKGQRFVRLGGELKVFVVE